ncbi:hypothetical protein KAZ57_01700 [Patescibacteria group bacterium]|nr:hypothetical protein [Patescibacteria group bacterium]
MTFFVSAFTYPARKVIMNKNIYKKLIVYAVVSVITFSALPTNRVFAEEAKCEPIYGGGENCLVNKRFEIKKEVRLCEDYDKGSKECDDWGDWEDKITDVEEGDIFEFRIIIKNESDDEADTFNNMKMSDDFPDELEKLDGAGFTEYWDDFEPGEEHTFYIKAKVNSDEFDRDDNFENCVVNKAEVKWGDEFEGADTATVCYGDSEVTELPQTGALSYLTLTGVSMIVSGAFLKKKYKNQY